MDHLAERTHAGPAVISDRKIELHRLGSPTGVGQGNVILAKRINGFSPAQARDSGRLLRRFGKSQGGAAVLPEAHDLLLAKYCD